MRMLSPALFPALACAMVCAGCGAAPAPEAPSKVVRFATFNAALNRNSAGELGRDLATGDHPQAQAVAEIVQRARPDVLLLQEFDRDPEALSQFIEDYLKVSQGGAEAIDYPHVYQPEVNTGVPSGFDLDGNGKAGDPGDSKGFGKFPGQYGFAILSRWPIATDRIRSYQNLPWSTLPDALRPSKADGTGSWYTDEAWAALPLSSKNHVDVPVRTPQGVIHVIAAHPTPPVFDGPEDRNGRRNFDELRLVAAMLAPAAPAWLVDDTGGRRGLPSMSAFVIMGDMNADPRDGDSVKGAIAQVLEHPRVNPAAASGVHTPQSAGGTANAEKRPADRPPLKGDPAHHTAGWGLRVDYALPSANLEVKASGVFWPTAAEPHGDLVQPKMVDGKRRDPSSDHRLVWVDVSSPELHLDVREDLRRARPLESRRDDRHP
ncbi:MAG: endonuclease/exonuclease/phosphatase family protein [Bradymonadia bacterium]